MSNATPPYSAFALSAKLAANAAANPEDVLAAKRLLAGLGYYAAPDWGVTEFPDRALFDAIRAFQQDTGLRADGVLDPDGESEAALKAHAQHLQAQQLQTLGRHGDTLLAHISADEAALLKAAGGSGTVNPRTGLLEFWMGSGHIGGSKASRERRAKAENRAASAERAAQGRERSGDWSEKHGRTLGYNDFVAGGEYGKNNLDGSPKTGKELQAHFRAVGRQINAKQKQDRVKLSATLAAARAQGISPGAYANGLRAERERERAQRRAVERAAAAQQTRTDVAQAMQQAEAQGISIKAYATDLAEQRRQARVAAQASGAPSSANTSVAAQDQGMGQGMSPGMGQGISGAAANTGLALSATPATNQAASSLARAQSKLKAAELQAMAPAATPAAQARNIKALEDARQAVATTEAREQQRQAEAQAKAQAQANEAAARARQARQNALDYEGQAYGVTPSGPAAPSASRAAPADQSLDNDAQAGYDFAAANAAQAAENDYQYSTRAAAASTPAPSRVGWKEAVGTVQYGSASERIALGEHLMDLASRNEIDLDRLPGEVRDYVDAYSAKRNSNYMAKAAPDPNAPGYAREKRKYDRWLANRQAQADLAGINKAASNYAGKAFLEPSRGVDVDIAAGMNAILGRGVDPQAYDRLRTTVPTNYRNTPSAGLMHNLGSAPAALLDMATSIVSEPGRDAVLAAKQGRPVAEQAHIARQSALQQGVASLVGGGTGKVVREVVARVGNLTAKKGGMVLDAADLAVSELTSRGFVSLTEQHVGKAPKQRLEGEN